MHLFSSCIAYSGDEMQHLRPYHTLMLTHTRLDIIQHLWWVLSWFTWQPLPGYWYQSILNVVYSSDPMKENLPKEVWSILLLDSMASSPHFLPISGNGNVVIVVRTIFTISAVTLLSTRILPKSSKGCRDYIHYKRCYFVKHSYPSQE